jgi:hypothetical protein
MDYNLLVYKLGSIYSLLRELEAANAFQGEHTIAFTGADGAEHTVHVYIDGTSLEMEHSNGSAGFSSSSSISGAGDF